ncbi:MAG TPA: hypothetical protein DCR04_13870 [Flavobacteriales bacterium]|nr:hypothetical protein [Flavobacteriales bacterium]
MDIVSNPDQSVSYEETDYLLGWKYSRKQRNNSKYPSKFDSFYLTNSIPCRDTLNILITGGSTSDLILDSNICWPVFLQEKLQQEGYCTNVIVAAIGGYHSGQEFLKLIRSVNLIKPDIHISYSGANELLGNMYSITATDDLLRVKHNTQSFVLPYTYHNISEVFYTTKDLIGIYTSEYKTEAPQFWKQNMNFMEAISNQLDYSFVGILQPVLGIGAHEYDLNSVLEKRQFAEHHGKKLQHALESYHLFYPEAIQICEAHAFIHDFTNVFANEPETPFFDDCHITTEYNKILADKVYDLLITEKLLAIKTPSAKADERFFSK